MINTKIGKIIFGTTLLDSTAIILFKVSRLLLLRTQECDLSTYSKIAYDFYHGKLLLKCTPGL